MSDVDDARVEAEEDRAFRPDVEGLRAVAIALVVLFHFQVPGFPGGYVGVDVFFVVSGYVICGLLLRERARSDATSFADFYGRRSRRILPAATLVLLVTVTATCVLVGRAVGRGTAIDGRWVAVFLANVRFASPASNPLSPLGAYWSLAVEEQFYLVFPALFVLVAAARRGPVFRTRLLVGLAVVVAGSFALSVVQTGSDPRWAYLSPFTRAWELAAGAALAAASPMLVRVPVAAARVATWSGMVMVVAAACTFRTLVDYPGWRVLVPVVGTALVVGAGVRRIPGGAESLLGTGPFRWLGRRSYSLYLWHWPVIVITAALGHAVTSWTVKVVCLVLSLALTVVTYRFVEAPVHRARLGPRRSLQLGAGLIAGALAVLTVVIAAS